MTVVDSVFHCFDTTLRLKINAPRWDRVKFGLIRMSRDAIEYFFRIDRVKLRLQMS